MFLGPLVLSLCFLILTFVLIKVSLLPFNAFTLYYLLLYPKSPRGHNLLHFCAPYMYCFLGCWQFHTPSPKIPISFPYCSFQLLKIRCVLVQGVQHYLPAAYSSYRCWSPVPPSWIRNPAVASCCFLVLAPVNSYMDLLTY